MKRESDPLAMEDHDYPDWLWRILEDKQAAEESGTDGDIYCRSLLCDTFGLHGIGSQIAGNIRQLWAMVNKLLQQNPNLSEQKQSRKPKKPPP